MGRLWDHSPSCTSLLHKLKSEFIVIIMVIKHLPFIKICHVPKVFKEIICFNLLNKRRQAVSPPFFCWRNPGSENWRKFPEITWVTSGQDHIYPSLVGLKAYLTWGKHSPAGRICPAQGTGQPAAFCSSRKPPVTVWLVLTTTPHCWLVLSL